MYWEDYLEEQGVKVNSLKACYSIFNKLLEKHKTTKKTLKAYKGIESDKTEWIVKKVINVAEEVKENLDK